MLCPLALKPQVRATRPTRLQMTTCRTGQSGPTDDDLFTFTPAIRHRNSRREVFGFRATKGIKMAGNYGERPGAAGTLPSPSGAGRRGLGELDAAVVGAARPFAVPDQLSPNRGFGVRSSTTKPWASTRRNRPTE